MAAPTQEDLLRAIEKEPYLTNFGIGIFEQHRKSKEEREVEFEKERENLRQNLREFQLCCEWLSTQQPIKTIDRKSRSSYGLKHVVEDYYDHKEYVSNGAFIAAVIHMGIPYKINPESPNVLVALSRKRLHETESVKHATVATHS
jgi:hypothetical protein